LFDGRLIEMPKTASRAKARNDLYVLYAALEVSSSMTSLEGRSSTKT
jgi:hypothetical protein